jgi:hypothetical protein
MPVERDLASQSAPARERDGSMLTTLPLDRGSSAGRSRAGALVSRFERAHAEFMAAVEQCSDGESQGVGRAQGIGSMTDVSRLADDYPILAGFIAAVATAQPLPPLRNHRPAAPNGREAGPRPARSTGDALGQLRRRGAIAAALLRGLSDEQLERRTSYFGTRLSAAQLIDELLITHVDEHRSGF